MSASNPCVFKSSARRLAVLLALDERPVGDWQATDLRAIYEHQWSSPVFGPAPVASGASVRSGGFRSWTYRDLFRLTRPPLEVLILAKDFGKMHCKCTQGPLPQEIGRVIYYASIFAALVRLGQRITTLSDEALREGVRWGLAQPWVDSTTRALFRQTFALLAGSSSRKA